MNWYKFCYFMLNNFREFFSFSFVYLDMFCVLQALRTRSSASHAMALHATGRGKMTPGQNTPAGSRAATT